MYCQQTVQLAIKNSAVIYIWSKLSALMVGLNMYDPKALNITCGVNNGVLNVSMPEVILDEPGVDAFIR